MGKVNLYIDDVQYTVTVTHSFAKYLIRGNELFPSCVNPFIYTFSVSKFIDKFVNMQQ